MKIKVHTEIAAPIQRCFDLARSIDLHVASTAPSGETATAGVKAGLIGDGETVSWRGKHFGIWFCHTSKITAFEPPRYFRDSMLAGTFKRYEHDHCFEFAQGHTVMTDIMDFEAPYGWLGKITERVVLGPHLRRFLQHRNLIIKKVAESDEWKRFVPEI